MTLTTPAAEEIIKTDVLGRMRTSAARRESLLDEFEKSGLSAKKFAGLSGLKYQTLATWLQKRRRQGPARPGAS
jgi:transposase